MNIDDVAFLKAPGNWPMWPYVPVKRASKEEHELPELGVVSVSVDGKELCVYPGVELFSMNIVQEMKEATRVVQSAEQIVADGWRVD